MIASIAAGIAGAGTPFPSKTHISSPAAAAVVGSCWLFPKHIVLDAGLHSRELPRGIQVCAVEVDAETEDVEIIRSAAVSGRQCQALYQSADLASSIR